MKYEMIGCDILPDEKIIVVYQNSYISDKLKKEKESQGWKVVEGVRRGRDGKPLPKKPPSFPVHGSEQMQKSYQTETQK